MKIVSVLVFLFFVALSLSTMGTKAHAAPTSAAAPPYVQFQSCAGGNLTAYIEWASTNTGQQWLDLSLSDYGFAPGTFLSAGPLTVSQRAYLWGSVLQNRTHYVRVNTLTAAGWQPGPTASFTTGDCGRPVPARLDVALTTGCEGGMLVESFSWTTATPIGLAQWLDLSTQNSGFAPGTFVSSELLVSVAATFRWAGLLPDATHYWRLNTWTGTQWVTSATGTFKTLGLYVSAIDGTCSLVLD